MIIIYLLFFVILLSISDYFHKNNTDFMNKLTDNGKKYFMWILGFLTGILCIIFVNNLLKILCKN